MQDALHAGSPQVLDYLLARGAAPDATNESGASALVVAAAGTAPDETIRQSAIRRNMRLDAASGH